MPLNCYWFQKAPPQVDNILKMIVDTASEFSCGDKIIYKFSTQVSTCLQYFKSEVNRNKYNFRNSLPTSSQL